MARARARPDWAIVGPSCETKSIGPSADAREEMALVIAGKFGRQDIFDRPFIDIAWCNVSSRNEFAQPSGCFSIIFIVVSP